MPKDDVTRRRHALLVDVTQAASEVSRLIHEARDLDLPVEPVSARAATAWSAGPFSWRSCRPNPEPDQQPAPVTRRGPVGVAARCSGPWWRHDGYVPEIDDDQLAALRRLRAAFGPIEVVEVVSHDPAVGPDASMQAHALLMRALTDPNWRTASQALDDLMRKLLVVHRLLEAEERLAKRRPRRNG